jgi:ketosteroid isomerase-like protein
MLQADNPTWREESTMSEQNVDAIKKGYEAFASGDVEGVMGLFDDNIEWIEPGESAISGTYRGKGEVGELMARFGEKGLTATPKRFLSDGDDVVALTEVSAGGETGQDADVFTVRGGKVVRVQIYTDTAMMERVFGKKQVAAG